MSKAPKSKNILWSHGLLTHEERSTALKQKGAILWFTGLSGSGKSTVAKHLEKFLIEEGYFATILDGDNIRFGLNKDLGFSSEDRKENIRRIGEVARLFCEANVLVLTAFISPYRADRDMARDLVPPGYFFEIFCDAPLSSCEERDPKGLYKKARRGDIGEFTGVSAPYEPPLKPDITLKTATESIEQSVKHLVSFLKLKGVL